MRQHWEGNNLVETTLDIGSHQCRVNGQRRMRITEVQLSEQEALESVMQQIGYVCQLLADMVRSVGKARTQVFRSQSCLRLVKIMRLAV